MPHYHLCLREDCPESQNPADELWRELFEETANPIFAWQEWRSRREALTLPIPGWVASYFDRCAEVVERIAAGEDTVTPAGRTVLKEKKSISRVPDVAKSILSGFGFIGRRGIRNAFTQYARMSSDAAIVLFALNEIADGETRTGAYEAAANKFGLEAKKVERAVRDSAAAQRVLTVLDGDD